MNPVHQLPIAGLALALLLNALPLAAQEAARDPTVAPGETGIANQSPAGLEGMTVLVRDGKPYLMVGARLYAPGDKVGNLRVERIAEKEVWFHDGTALIKVPRFAGIERKTIAARSQCARPSPNAETTAKPSTTAASKAKAAKKKVKRTSPAPAHASLPAVAPCEDAQP